MRVLIVEDEHGLAEAVQIGLAREGYAADVALTRAEAERKLAVSPYDLLLLDVTLPDGNGLDLAAAVRSGECDVPLRSRRTHPDAHGARRPRRTGARVSTPAPTTTSSSRSPCWSSRRASARCCVAR